jgi:hypothetical protein
MEISEFTRFRDRGFGKADFTKKDLQMVSF